MTLPLIIITLLATLIVCVVVSWIASGPTTGPARTLEDAEDDGWIHWRDALDRTTRAAPWVAPGEVDDDEFEGDEEVTDELPQVERAGSAEPVAAAAR